MASFMKLAATLLTVWPAGTLKVKAVGEPSASFGTDTVPTTTPLIFTCISASTPAAGVPRA